MKKIETRTLDQNKYKNAQVNGTSVFLLIAWLNLVIVDFLKNEKDEKIVLSEETFLFLRAVQKTFGGGMWDYKTTAKSDSVKLEGIISNFTQLVEVGCKQGSPSEGVVFTDDTPLIEEEEKTLHAVEKG